jgi:DNA polymerase-3 subunit delta'
MKVTQLHASSWQRLREWRARLPHALLFSGPRGLEKVELAKAFAAGLFCEARRPDGEACGACLPCRWFGQGHHPDFRVLLPKALRPATEEENQEARDKTKRGGQDITIDQVRELDDFLAVGTHRQGLRIILVYPAENLNRAAANALLKTLEEPPASTLFLLVSSEPMSLLPTLRSRCQNLAIPLPSPALSTRFLDANDVSDAATWLALAGGAPGLARRLAQETGTAWRETLLQALESGQRLEVIATAATLEKTLKTIKGENPLPQLVNWSQKWLIDLNLAAQGLPIRFYLRQRDRITALALASQPLKLARYYRQLLQLRQESEHPLNVRLFLEQFFFSYRALFVE